MEKKQIIEEYRRVKKELGHQPSQKEFCNNSKVKKRMLSQIFGNKAFNKLVSECGDNPKQFLKPKSDIDKVLIQYGELSRKIGRIPTITDWENADLQPKSVTGIEKSHKLRWSDLKYKFRQFSTNKTEWKDIFPLYSQYESIVLEKITTHEKCFVYLQIDSKNGNYKIGISKHPEFREKTLQSESPTVKLVAKKEYVTRRMAACIEKALHECFSHKKVRGEWFSLNEVDVDEIKSILDDELN